MDGLKETALLDDDLLQVHTLFGKEKNTEDMEDEISQVFEGGVCLSSSDLENARETDLTDGSDNDWSINFPSRDDIKIDVCPSKQTHSNLIIPSQSDKVNQKTSNLHETLDIMSASLGLMSLSHKDINEQKDPERGQEDVLSFQDIESDFFEDEDDTVSGKQCKSQVESQLVNFLTDFDTESVTSQYNMVDVNALQSNKTSIIGNSVLRSTIGELQNALSSTNKLLASRDDEISIIRAQYINLKLRYDKLEDDHKVQKEALEERDKEIMKLESKISLLNLDIERLNKEISVLNYTVESPNRKTIQSINEMSTPPSSPDSKTISCPEAVSSRRLCHRKSCSFEVAEQDTAAAPLMPNGSSPISKSNDCFSKSKVQELEKQVVQMRSSSKLCRRQRPASMFIEGDGTVKNSWNGIYGKGKKDIKSRLGK